MDPTTLVNFRVEGLRRSNRKGPRRAGPHLLCDSLQISSNRVAKEISWGVLSPVDGVTEIDRAGGTVTASRIGKHDEYGLCFTSRVKMQHVSSAADAGSAYSSNLLNGLFVQGINH